MKIEKLHYKQSGVYAIHNSTNGHHYIGSAVSLKRRTRDHISKLNKGIHENKHLQNAFNKYGESAFWVEILEVVDDKLKLTEREQFYLDTTVPHYNILKFARSALGFKHSQEERTRISAMAKARHAAMTPEERQNQKNVFCMTGKEHSPETKILMSKQRLGKKKSEHHASACAAAWKNSAHAENYKNTRAACVAARAKQYVVTDPVGTEYEVTNMSAFCRDNNLSQSHMSGIATGSRKQYKGWTAKYKTA